MITLSSLNSLTVKDLAQEAKKRGVPGWHSLRKDELISELLKIAKKNQRAAAKKAKPVAKAEKKPTTTVKSGTKTTTAKISAVQRETSPRSMTTKVIPKPKVARTSKSADETPKPPSKIAEKLREDRENAENLKNLALISTLDREQKPPGSDRLVLIVRDSYWVQAYWEITKATVQRAKAALVNQWHEVRPVLRLLEISTEGNTNATENTVEEFVIHGGVKNWFIHLKKPGRPYRVAIGYRTADGRFHLIAKSNQVKPPCAGTAVDENWTDITNDAEKFYALSGGFDDSIPSDDLQVLFEEKTRHPIHAPAFERLGSGINGHANEFAFQVDAHLIVFGSTHPSGSVTIAGEPVRLQKDGTFSLKVDLPDRRQVLPVVASSRDGTQQRTTVLAIERNTKVMEPLDNQLEMD